MIIPFLITGIAVLAAVFGIGKSIEASITQKKANRTNEDANNIIKSISKSMEMHRKNCRIDIENLGKCKIKILLY